MEQICGILVPMENHLTDISRVIQLAVAPVFLLTAVATLINALNTRLGRIVDRRRVVYERQSDKNNDTKKSQECNAELAALARRSKLIYAAIFCVVLSALFVCLVVAGAFMGALFSADISKLVAAFFICAMLSMITGLGLFLREVYFAVQTGTHNHP